MESGGPTTQFTPGCPTQFHLSGAAVDACSTTGRRGVAEWCGPGRGAETVARNIAARRKLSELYVRGVEVRFDADGGHVGPFEDDDGKPVPLSTDQVAVWVQPPSPLQREMAMRDAQAQRARSLLRTLRDSEAEEYLTGTVFVAEMDDATLVDYILLHESEQRRQEAIRDVLDRDEWSDVVAYQDAMRKVEEDGADETDPEYAELLKLDLKYGDQVSKRQAELSDSAHDVLMMLGRERQEKQALDLRKEVVGSQAFMHEYELQMTYYSVRDPKDHAELFFGSAKEWAEQDEEIRATVGEALIQFIGEVGEAKNSPRVAPGSEPSEPPSKPETSAASTPAT